MSSLSPLFTFTDMWTAHCTGLNHQKHQRKKKVIVPDKEPGVRRTPGASAVKEANYCSRKRSTSSAVDTVDADDYASSAVA